MCKDRDGSVDKVCDIPLIVSSSENPDTSTLEILGEALRSAAIKFRGTFFILTSLSAVNGSLTVKDVSTICGEMPTLTSLPDTSNTIKSNIRFEGRIPNVECPRMSDFNFGNFFNSTNSSER